LCSAFVDRDQDQRLFTRRRWRGLNVTPGKGGLLDLPPLPPAAPVEMTLSEALAELRADER
jgi:hypothetical protein